MTDLEPTFEYQNIHEEIRSEYSLIANRLSWYVTSQSFLVTAFAISRGSGFTWFHWFSTILLPAIGILASVLIYPSIVGACETIKLWHMKQDAFYDRHKGFKDAFELKRAAWIIPQGVVFPKLMPVLFGLFWLVVLVASYF